MNVFYRCLQNYFQSYFRLFLLLILMFVTCATTTLAAANLSYGARGEDVEKLQTQLRGLGYSIQDRDGEFDAATKQAVLLFQRDQRIKITGNVDAKTWKELDRLKPYKAVSPKTPSTTVIPKKDTVPETEPIRGASKQLPTVVKTAKKYIGVPYKFGGVTPKGFDCSGYIQYIFSQNKIKLPRSADEQYKVGKKVSQSQLKTGDIVFFSTYEKGASHCGLYLEDGKFIHVSTSKGVRIDELKDPYWKPKYLGAKRVAE